MSYLTDLKRKLGQLCTSALVQATKPDCAVAVRRMMAGSKANLLVVRTWCKILSALITGNKFFFCCFLCWLLCGCAPVWPLGRPGCCFPEERRHVSNATVPITFLEVFQVANYNTWLSYLLTYTGLCMQNLHGLLHHTHVDFLHGCVG